MAYLPAAYPQQNWNYSGVGQQMYQPYQAQAMGQQAQAPAQHGGGLIWVDGEVGAKAYQMPQGWPANQPIALWDTNDTVIYLKSTNPMGMPNPLQKAHYKLEEYKTASGMSGVGQNEPDMSQYVKKEDLERMKQDLMDTIGSMSAERSRRRNVEGE